MSKALDLDAILAAADRADGAWRPANDIANLVQAVRDRDAKLDALGSLDGIRTAALALPVEDRNALRMALTASLPLPRCLDTSPALMAKVAQTMTVAQREELIGLLMKRRPS